MKYELVKDDFKIINKIKVYRIRAIADFEDIKAGDLGGYVSDESCLINDLEDTGWIDSDSVVVYSTLSDTKILRSYIEDCNIEDCNIKYSYIFSSNIEDCKIKNSTIYSSDIEDSNIKYSYIFSSKIKNCKKYNEIINNSLSLALKRTIPFFNV